MPLFIINFLFLHIDYNILKQMDKKELDIAYFLSFCIEQYKMKYNLLGEEAMTLFEKYNVLQYLSDNFEVLHTQSRQWLIEEIEDYITKQEEET